jgi:hypothetical protein
MSQSQPTVRERIVAAFAVALGARRARRTYDTDDLPALALWDASDDSAERTPYGQVEISMTLTLETFHEAVPNDDMVSSQANALLGQYQTAAAADRTLGGLCDDIAYTGCTIYYPDDGSHLLGVDVSFSVRFRHDAGNPYANSQ